jgi:hypothetical protein
LSVSRLPLKGREAGHGRTFERPRVGIPGDRGHARLDQGASLIS